MQWVNFRKVAHLPEMPFVFPEEQRVLTELEYQQLGYLVRGESPKVDPDKPLSTGYSFPAYRAETKEEFAVDYALGLAKEYGKRDVADALEQFKRGGGSRL